MYKTHTHTYTYTHTRTHTLTHTHTHTHTYTQTHTLTHTDTHTHTHRHTHTHTYTQTHTHTGLDLCALIACYSEPQSGSKCALHLHCFSYDFLKPPGVLLTRLVISKKKRLSSGANRDSHSRSLCFPHAGVLIWCVLPRETLRATGRKLTFYLCFACVSVSRSGFWFFAFSCQSYSMKFKHHRGDASLTTSVVKY